MRKSGRAGKLGGRKILSKITLGINLARVMLNFIDRLLTKIRVNNKAMSIERLNWWVIIILTKLFGRRVKIEGGEGKTLRILPIIWGGKVHLLGAEHDFVQIDFSSPYTLRIKTSPTVPVENGRPIVLQPSRNDAAVHIILCHLPPEKTETILRNLQILGPNYEIILAYGGRKKTSSESIFRINTSCRIRACAARVTSSLTMISSPGPMNCSPRGNSIPNGFSSLTMILYHCRKTTSMR